MYILCAFAGSTLGKAALRSVLPTGALSVRHIEANAMQNIIVDEKLEVYLPGRKTNSASSIRTCIDLQNVLLGQCCIDLNGKEECAEGAKVTLMRPGDDKVSELSTDYYGDFKFDNLEPNSGKYTLWIEMKGYAKKVIDVDLKDSLSME